MNESILMSVKSMLGIVPECEDFDGQIKLYINTVIAFLRQIGVGPEDGFVVLGPQQTWPELLGDTDRLEMVKAYVGLKVRLMFDPSASSVVTEAINNQIKELEWRINVAVDPKRG